MPTAAAVLTSYTGPSASLVMHGQGRRMWAITWELIDDSPSLDAEAQESTRLEMAGRYRHIAEVARTVTHNEGLGARNPLQRAVRDRVRPRPPPARLPATAPAAVDSADQRTRQLARSPLERQAAEQA